jgi:6-phosphogluconolactonase (cycloisomerase 2 family)
MLLISCLVLASAPVAPHTARAADATSRFVPVAPSRLFDTRHGQGPVDDLLDGIVPAHGMVRVQVAGRFGIPTSGATAVIVNVTITEALAAGFVQVLPESTSPVGAFSNLNVESAGQTISNQVTVPLGADGTFSVYTQGGGHLLADVFGYFTPAVDATAGRYEPLAAPTPRRVIDTRDSTIVGPNGTLRVAITTGTALGGGVVAPGQASAVVLNLTVTQALGAGYWQVVPTNGATALGASSNLNVTRSGQTISNQVIVPIGAGGTITVFAQTGGHVVIDIAGIFTGAASPRTTAGLFVPIAPARLVDTRDPANSNGAGAVPARGELVVQVGGRFGVPLNAAAVALNVTATESVGAGFVQVLPFARATLGATSNLNVEFAGQTIPNAAYATLGVAGRVSLYSQSGGHLLADVAGWFAGASPAPQFAFIGTYNSVVTSPSLGITSFHFDPTTGGLNVSSVRSSIDPTFLALHPSKRILYTVNEINGAGTVEAYTIDAVSGALTLLNRRTVGSSPGHLVIDATGQHLITADYNSATWTVVALAPDGSLGAVTDTVVRTGSGPHTRQLSPHPHGLAFDPSGRFLAGVDLGTDRLEIFELVNDHLVSRQVVSIAAGSGPRHVAFLPNGQAIYVINELTATISVFAFNAATGAVGALRQTIETVTPGFPLWRSAAEIVVHPSGKFLYASNRKTVDDPVSDSIAAFSINQTTGVLTSIGYTTTNIRTPRTMGFDPTGTWLYSLNQDGDSIVQFLVDQANGALIPTGRVTALRVPVSIAITAS